MKNASRPRSLRYDNRVFWTNRRDTCDANGIPGKITGSNWMFVALTGYFCCFRCGDVSFPPDVVPFPLPKSWSGRSPFAAAPAFFPRWLAEFFPSPFSLRPSHRMPTVYYPVGISCWYRRYTPAGKVTFVRLLPHDYLSQQNYLVCLPSRLGLVRAG